MDPTIGAVQSNRSGVHDLPSEMVEQTRYYRDGVLSLGALMTVCSQARQIYQERPKATLFALIRSSS